LNSKRSYNNSGHAINISDNEIRDINIPDKLEKEFILLEQF